MTSKTPMTIEGIVSERLADPWLTPLFDDSIPEKMKREAIETLLRTTLHSYSEYLVEEIEKIKESVQKSHGTFKYDSCYDDCIEAIRTTQITNSTKEI